MTNEGPGKNDFFKPTRRRFLEVLAGIASAPVVGTGSTVKTLANLVETVAVPLLNASQSSHVLSTFFSGLDNPIYHFDSKFYNKELELMCRLFQMKLSPGGLSGSSIQELFRNSVYYNHSMKAYAEHSGFDGATANKFFNHDKFVGSVEQIFGDINREGYDIFTDIESRLQDMANHPGAYSFLNDANFLGKDLPLFDLRMAKGNMGRMSSICNELGLGEQKSYFDYMRHDLHMEIVSLERDIEMRYSENDNSKKDEGLGSIDFRRGSIEGGVNVFYIDSVKSGIDLYDVLKKFFEKEPSDEENKGTYTIEDLPDGNKKLTILESDLYEKFVDEIYKIKYETL